jgi:hypothetical protein
MSNASILRTVLVQDQMDLAPTRREVFDLFREGQKLAVPGRTGALDRSFHYTARTNPQHEASIAAFVRFCPRSFRKANSALLLRSHEILFLKQQRSLCLRRNSLRKPVRPLEEAVGQGVELARKISEEPP